MRLKGLNDRAAERGFAAKEHARSRAAELRLACSEFVPHREHAAIGVLLLCHGHQLAGCHHVRVVQPEVREAAL